MMSAGTDSDPTIRSIRWQGLIVVAIAAASVTLVGMLWLVFPQLFESWELATYDLRSRWQGVASADEQIVIISRDEASDKKFGVGVWDRSIFAKTITALGKAGARTIALDFYMPDAASPEGGNVASDRDLVTAVVSAGTVVAPVAVVPSGVVDDAGPSIVPDVLARLVLPFSPDVVRALPQASRIKGPFPALASAAAGMGHIAAWPDADGVYRRVPTFVGVGERAVPALGVAMAAHFLQVPPDHIELVPGDALRFRDAHLPDGRIKTISLLVDGEGRLLISYAGRWKETQFHNFPFLQVWNAIQDKKDGEATLQETFRGKLVVLLHAALGSDKRRTPYEVGAPGGYIILNVANTLIKEHALRETGAPIGWLLAFLLGLGSAATNALLPGWLGLFAAGGLGVLYTMVSFLAMPFNGFVLPVLPPLATLLVASPLTLAWRQRQATDRAKRLARDYEALQRGLAAQRNLLAQQETEIAQLKAERAAAQESSARKEEGPVTLEQRIALLQEQAIETRRVVKEHEEKLAVMQATQRDVGESRSSVQVSQEQPSMRQATKLTQAPLTAEERERFRQECQEHGIITSDPVMLSLWKDFRAIATDRYLPILILGESGTGKELFAQAAHKLSGRKEQAFIARNLKGVAPTLFESELFGHAKGAFSDAKENRKGAFRQADGGTIFLDEIGDLSLDLQAKLFRVLQESVVTPVGGDAEVKVDVRVVSATNQDLERMIVEGRFREELYYRLKGFVVRVPPLRDRPGDIPELARYFVRKAAKKRGHQNTISQAALNYLQFRTWKGNIRELQSCLESAVVLAKGVEITDRHLDVGEMSEVSGVAPTANQPPPVDSDIVGYQSEPDDRRLLQELQANAFVMSRAAEKLAWNRDTVTEWFKGLCFEALVHHEFDRDKAAASLAGESGLTKLVLKKLNEYIEGLSVVVKKNPPSGDNLAWCKQHFRNLPARYYIAVEALIRARIV